MNQQNNTHPRWIIGTGTVAIGVIGTMMAMTIGTAHAMPGHGEPPVGPAPVTHVKTTHKTGHQTGHLVPHGCFITPHTWNDEIAGPMPVCYTYVP
jgi:hypothetical protein